MRHLNKLANVLGSAALALLTLTGCEGGDLYHMDTPDWISSKIDSINNSKTTTEEVLEGMQEDVYTIGKTDFTSGFWSSFSKYYVIGENQKWNAQFNLNINPSDNTYYKNYGVEYFKRHTGNSYPTHGLGPICQYMGINRGDRLERLVVGQETRDVGRRAQLVRDV